MIAANAITGAGGSLTLSSSLQKSYVNAAATGAAGQQRFQVIRVPQYSSVTLAGTLSAAPWNGNSGGVLAIDVAGTLTMNGQVIDANGDGFRGGGGLQVTTGNGALSSTAYRTTIGSSDFGSKGEGAAGTPRYTYDGSTVTDNTTEGYPNGSAARGAPGNAGGGGNEGNPGTPGENSGGGGGANGGAGGLGGNTSTGNVAVGGFGGSAFTPTAIDRVVLGGGGGAGSRNSTGPSSGERGGGIIMVRAAAVSGTGTVRANGVSAPSNTNVRDGGGGGGAGGSILFLANSGGFANVTFNANGGAGGSTQTSSGSDAERVGPGGGGGGGVIRLSSNSTAALTVAAGSNGTTRNNAQAWGATAGSAGVSATNATLATVPGASSGVECAPALTVTKTTSTPTVDNGGSGTTATYTVTVANAAGQATASSLAVSDTLPAGFTYASTSSVTLSGGATRPSTSNPTVGAAVPTWGQFTVPAGGSVAITFVVDIASTVGPGTYQNPATATYLDPARTSVGGTTTASYASGSSTGEDVIVRWPDFTIAKSHTGSFSRGGTHTYSITATNSGNRASSGLVTVADTLPAGLTPTLASGTGWTCGIVSQTVTCTRSDALAAGSAYPAVTITVTVSQAATSPLTNTVTVTNAGEFNTGNNSSSDPTTIVSTADLAVTKSDGSANALAGGAISYVVTVTNNGPTNVAGATFTDTVPASITGVSWTCSVAGGGSCGAASGSGNAISTTTTLNSGAVATYTISGTVPQSASGTIVNTATAAVPGGVTDPTAGNNSATDTDTVIRSADIAVTKSDGQGSVAPGGPITYLVTVTNNGPSNTAGIVLTDTVPVQVRGVAWTCAISSGVGSCSVPSGINNVISTTIDLNSGAVATFTITGTAVADATGAIANTASSSVPAGTVDPTSGNNSATDSDTVSGSPGAPVCAIPGNDGPSTTLTGVLNTYFPGTASAAAGTTTITLGTSTGSTAPIAVGDKLLVIQMQGVDINSTNTNAYGDAVAGEPASGASSWSNAGTFEYVTAASAVPAGGGSLTVSAGLLNAYVNAAATATKGQQRFQVIRVPQYSSATLSGNVTATAWNGTAGGIVAMDVAGVLNLNGFRIDVSTSGFRGGGWRSLAGGAGSSTDVRTSASVAVNGSKGEGVAGTPRFTYNGTAVVDNTAEGYPNGSHARGAPGNAGGGGSDSDPVANQENSGGGGGGNGGAGGKGGFTWNSVVDIGGSGGAAVPAPGLSHLVMGGGGGAGTSNNVGPASGAVGGGIVLLDIGSFGGTGEIRANGGNGQASEQDGAGGGGAGGTVAVVSSSGPLTGLTVNANGGGGGNAWPTQAPGTYPGDRHGPGGGGGGGVVLLSTTGATTSATGGANGTTTTAAEAYGATAGSSGTVSTSAGARFAGSGGPSSCSPLLTVTKSTSTPTVVNRPSGSSATYTILVSNAAGRSAAQQLAISDLLPTGFTYASTGTVTLSGGATRPSTTNPAVGATNPSWSQFRIPGGGSVALTFTVNVAGTVADGTYQNPATATYLNPARTTASGTTTSSYDPASSAAENVTVTSSDMTITKSHTGNFARGGTHTYTLTASNSGTGPTAGTVTVADTLPSGLTPTLASGSGWSCGISLQTVTCTRSDSLASTVSYPAITITVSVSPSATSPLTNTATVSGGSQFNTANDSASDPTTIVSSADLAVTKSDGQATAIAGAAISYAVTVTNNGPSNVAGAAFTDTVPASITGVTWTCSVSGAGSCGGASGSGNAISTTVTLNSGAVATYVISGTVSQTASGSIVNTATATVPVGTTDPTPGNDSATDTDTVVRRADLAVTKSDGQATAIAGAPISYAVTVTNNGPSNVAGAAFTDTVPASITGVTWTCSVSGVGSCGGASGSGNAISTTVTLNSGAVATYVISGTVSQTASGSIVNTATATVPVGTTDPTPGNDSATDTDTLARLSIVKSATPSTYSAVGQVVSYSFLVTNSGNVTLSGPFTVADNRTTNEACPATASLLPGASITCTASYTITQADLNVGSVTNVASASGSFNAIPVTSATDTETVSAVQSPALSIVKSATPSTYSAVGQVVSYSFLVTNSGNVTLSGPFTVADNRTTNEACPATASLLPGASITCTASYTITQADLNVGSVTNVASASGSFNAIPVTSATDTETVSAVQSPALSIVKSATPSTYSAVGQVVSYSFLVTNSGNVTLSGPFTVADNRTTNEACPATASLLPGASITCTASYTITQADLNVGSVTNVASASGSFNAIPVTSATDTETVSAVQSPALSIVKSATPSTYSAVGQVVSYSFLVTNSGNVTLSGPFTVADNRTTNEACPATASLLPGASITCTASYTITQADLNVGSVTNVASASGSFNAIPVTSATDTETVSAVQSPALSIVKSATPSTYSAVGQVVSYSFLVTNSGNVTLSGPFTVADNRTTNEACPATASLLPGASITCTASYTITQADLNVGSVTNVASASGSFNAIPVTSATDTETVSAVQSPALSIVKSATPSTYSAVGQVVSYSFLVTNSGNVTLSGPFTVADNRTTNEACPATASLLPGASITCTASYTITQADLNVGSVTNVASASGSFNAIPVTSATDTETVSAVQSPALSIVKSATPSTYSAVGQVVSYSFLVTNSGNVTLSGPFTVADNRTTNEACPATASLLPGASITCTASYTITQADLNVGSVTNVASASGSFNAIPVTSATDTETVSAVQSPALSIVKSATPSTYSAVGQVVSYSFLVTNSGNVTLSGPFTVADNRTTNEACPATASLLPGASITCTASYTITQADLNVGSVTNVASASGSFNAIPVTSATDTETVSAVQSPALSIVKSATPSTYSAVGQVVSYSFLVTNSGNVTLSGPFTVADNRTTNEACPATASLLPGASITCTASYTITQADLNVGSVTNVASASGSFNAIPVTSATDTETVSAVQSPALSIVKSATPSTYSAVGQVVSYSFLVTNSGNVTLSGPFTVADNRTTNEACPATASLLPGASITCTATHTVVQADLDAGSITNTASASNGTVISPTDTETVSAVQSPSLSVVKSSSTSSVTVAGQVVPYTLTVTNTGNVTLTGVSAADPKCSSAIAGPTGDTNTDSRLQRTETWVYTCSRTVTQAEVDAGGSLANTVTASSSQAPPATATLLIPIVRSPGLSIVKSASPLTYGAVGQVVSYSFRVTNSGNVTLAGPFTVADNRTTDEACPATASLAPGAFIICTASHTIAQADLDAGSITNVASASNGAVTSATDTATVTAVQSPGLSLSKVGVLDMAVVAPAGRADVGDTIGYTLTAGNTGNVTLTGVTVVDPLLGAVVCVPGQPATLAPGATVVCTGSYTLTQADIDAGKVDNTATADSTQTPPTVTSNTVPLTRSPALSIVKSATPSTYSAVGQVVSYSFVVRNSGNTTLAGPFTVADDRTTNEACPATPSLAPGASITCTASYTITQADLDNGSVTNVASASNGTVTSPTDSATVTAVQNTGLSQTKVGVLDMTVVPPSSRVDVGDTIAYTITATNTGNTTTTNVTLTGVTVADPLLGPVACTPAQPATLAPGDAIVCTGSYGVTQADIDAGKVDNTATADSDQTLPTVTPNTVPLTRTPALSIVKTASPSTYDSVGDVIGYSFLVTNSGNVTLSGPFTVADNRTTDEACPATASLLPGASITCTATHTVVQADLDAGSITNTASASNGTVISPTDTATVTAVQTKSWTVAKSSPTSSLAAPGTVTYAYLVTNTGNVTLTGISLSDDNDDDDLSCPATTLAPSATLTCSASHSFTQAELDANGSPTAGSGSLANTVTASSSQAPPATATLLIPIVRSPGLSIVKSASPLTYGAVGQVVSYSFRVTNSGNVTLAGPFTVADNRTTDEACPATASLAPGAFIICTASHTIAQADLDAGSITNVASASNGAVTSATDTATVTAVQSPGLSLSKVGVLDMAVVAPAGRADVGDTIGYTLTAGNTGNVTLTGVTVVDPLLGAVVCVPGQPATLAPGATVVCTGSYTLTQADIDAGKVDNTATADSTQTPPTVTSNTVPLTRSPALSIVKSATPSTYSAVGQVVSYSFVVRNSGNTTLAGPFTVADDRTTNEACPATPSLAPGASITCTASYTITQADLDNGSVTNVASVSNGTVTSPTDSATVTAVQSPALSIVKCATPATYSAVGQVVSYSFVVANSGNTTLFGPFTVADDKTTDEACPVTVLLVPGASVIVHGVVHDHAG